MNQLKQYLDDGQCRGVARSAGGETVLFRRRGVIDLFELSTARPDFLCGASVADKVAGSVGSTPASSAAALSMC